MIKKKPTMVKGKNSTVRLLVLYLKDTHAKNSIVWKYRKDICNLLQFKVNYLLVLSVRKKFAVKVAFYTSG